MNEADREYIHKLIDHLIDGGQVGYEHFHKDKTIGSDEVALEALIATPNGYTIIERPMVYVYQANHTHMQSITSDELAKNDWDGIEPFLTRRSGELICSFPIEEQT